MASGLYTNAPGSVHLTVAAAATTLLPRLKKADHLLEPFLDPPPPFDDDDGSGEGAVGTALPSSEVVVTAALVVESLSQSGIDPVELEADPGGVGSSLPNRPFVPLTLPPSAAASSSSESEAVDRVEGALKTGDGPSRAGGS